MNTHEQIEKAIEHLTFKIDSEINPLEETVVVNSVMLFKVVSFDEDGNKETSLAIISDDNADFITMRGMLEKAIDHYR